MKYGYFIKILLAFFLAFAPTQAFAKTIKWSMQGDSLTLDLMLKTKVLPLKYLDKYMKL